MKLTLWKPGTPGVDPGEAPHSDLAAGPVSARGGRRLVFHVPGPGTYYLEVELGPPGSWARPAYRLTVTATS